MISVLIFSKDRACQLDLLLRSICCFAEGKIQAHVLYRSSSIEFEHGYNILRDKKYPCLVSIEGEKDYRNDTIRIIEEYTTELFGLCTDDTVLYRKFDIDSFELWDLMCWQNCHSLSLRCGLNITTQCHYRNDFYMKPFVLWENDKVFTWDTREHDYSTNNGRPFSIDFNIFDYDRLLKTLKEFEWDCPRTLDGIDTRYLGPKMMAFRESIIVNIPVNLAADVTQRYPVPPDNFSKFFSYPTEYLNAKYLEGYEIDLETIEHMKVYTSHQEFELKLCKI